MTTWTQRALLLAAVLFVVGWVMVLIDPVPDHVSGSASVGPGQTGVSSTGDGNTPIHQVGGLMVYGSVPVFLLTILLLIRDGLEAVVSKRRRRS